MNDFYIHPGILTMHRATLKKFKVNSLQELKPHQEKEALDFIEKKALKILKNTEGEI